MNEVEKERMEQLAYEIQKIHCGLRDIENRLDLLENPSAPAKKADNYWNTQR